MLILGQTVLLMARLKWSLVQVQQYQGSSYDHSLSVIIKNKIDMKSWFRTWEIKVIQIECWSRSRPYDPGCLQYHTGTTGRFESFNFGQTSSSLYGHLNDQLWVVNTWQFFILCHACKVFVLFSVKRYVFVQKKGCAAINTPFVPILKVLLLTTEIPQLILEQLVQKISLILLVCTYSVLKQRKLRE